MDFLKTVELGKQFFCYYVYTLFFYNSNFTRTKALILEKRIKNKLRTNSGLLTEHKNEVPRLAFKIIIRKHQSKAWLLLILYCM